MLFLTAILFLAVLVVALLVNNLYSSLDQSLINNTSTSSNYVQVEKNLLAAAKKYYNAYKDEVGQIILSDELIDENYLTVQKMTANNDICDGYVFVDGSTLTPYITCSYYETEGY